MSVRGLIATVLAAVLVVWTARADTYVLLVDEISDDVLLRGANLIKLPGATDLPEYLTIEFEQEIGLRAWTVVAQGDEYDDLRKQIGSQVGLIPDPNDPVNNGSVSFEIITIFDSFSYSEDDLRFPNAVIAVTDSQSDWENLYAPEAKDSSRQDGSVATTTDTRHEPAEPDVNDYVEVDVEPDFDFSRLRDVVVYPELARFRDMEGEVLVAALVDVDRSVRRVAIISSTNTLFNSYAAAAVLLTEFTPAKKNGKPIPLWVRIPIHFRLR